MIVNASPLRPSERTSSTEPLRYEWRLLNYSAAVSAPDWRWVLCLVPWEHGP